MADSVLEWICSRLNQISVAGRCQYKVAPSLPARFEVCGWWGVVGWVLLGVGGSLFFRVRSFMRLKGAFNKTL